MTKLSEEEISQSSCTIGLEQHSGWTQLQDPLRFLSTVQDQHTFRGCCNTIDHHLVLLELQHHDGNAVG